MGKQKIARLLAHLQDNHNQDIQNAAAIFTVAQGAVNQLDQLESELAAEPKTLPAAPSQLTQADLVSRYGNYNACRKAAKQAGISFRKSPRWEQLVTAFNYLAACQAQIDAYLQRYPNPNLNGVRVVIHLGQESQDR